MSRRTTVGVVDRALNERMNRWSAWLTRRLDAGPAGFGRPSFASMTIYGCRINPGHVDLGTPIGADDIEDVHETHDFVLSLEDHLQRIIVGYWIRQFSVARMAAMMEVAPATVKDRLAEINGRAQNAFEKSFAMCSK